MLVSFATNIKDGRERERGREEKGRKERRRQEGGKGQGTDAHSQSHALSDTQNPTYMHNTDREGEGEGDNTDDTHTHTNAQARTHMRARTHTLANTHTHTHTHTHTCGWEDKRDILGTTTPTWGEGADRKARCSDEAGITTGFVDGVDGAAKSAESIST